MIDKKIGIFCIVIAALLLLLSFNANYKYGNYEDLVEACSDLYEVSIDARDSYKKLANATDNYNIRQQYKNYANMYDGYAKDALNDVIKGREKMQMYYAGMIILGILGIGAAIGGIVIIKKVSSSSNLGTEHNWDSKNL